MPSPSTESQFADEDWYGRQLGDCKHSKVAFIDVDLTEATTAGAVFTECSFRGCAVR